MDLRPIATPPTDEERAAVDVVLGWEAAPHALHDVRSRRHLLLPALQAAQARRGWVSAGALGYICERLGVPPAEAYGVASFYALLSLSERPPVVVHVCDDIACQIGGAERLCEELSGEVGPAGAPFDLAPGERDGAMWLRSPCLGMCERAPAALVTIAGLKPREEAFGNATVAAVRARLQGDDRPPLSLRERGRG